MELTEEEYKSLEQFIFLIYTPNPNRNNVKVFLDGGDIRITMKNDVFLENILNILSTNLTKEVYENFIKIKDSLLNYGGYYYYDRHNNIFKQLEEKDLKQVATLTSKVIADELAKAAAENKKDLYENTYKSVLSKNIQSLLNKKSY